MTEFTVPVNDPFGNEAGSAGFLMLSSCLVFFMTPGVGLLYSGLSRSKNALNILYLSFASYIVVTIQWYVIGFSLSFSENGSGFIGNGDFAFFMNMGSGALRISAPGVPALVFAMYQLQFAAVTVAIIFGSVAERCRILPAMIFMAMWVTIVYSPIANWYLPN
jgi:ammonium transporter, Amt family